MLSLGPLPRPRPPLSPFIVREVRALLMPSSPPPLLPVDASETGLPVEGTPAVAATATATAAAAATATVTAAATAAAAAAAPHAAAAAATAAAHAAAAARAPPAQPFDLPCANQCSMFEELKASRSSWGIDSLGSVVVEVELMDGVVGVGVTVGGAPACFLVEEHFARFVEGQDVRNTEFIWEQMFRSCQTYGAKGLTMHALSAIDLALWDALGKARNEPVVNLLGGKTKEMCVAPPPAGQRPPGASTGTALSSLPPPFSTDPHSPPPIPPSPAPPPGSPCAPRPCAQTLRRPWAFGAASCPCPLAPATAQRAC